MLKNFFYLFRQTFVSLFFTTFLFMFAGAYADELTDAFGNGFAFLSIPLYVVFGVIFRKEKWQKSLVDAIAGFAYFLGIAATITTAGLLVPTLFVIFFFQLGLYGWLINYNLVVGWSKDNFAQSLYNDILEVCASNDVNIEKGVKAKIVRDYLNTYIKPKFTEHFAEPEFKKFIQQKLADGKSFQIYNNELLRLCNSLSPFFKKIYMKEYK